VSEESSQNFRIEAASFSETGAVRLANDDAVRIAPSHDLFIVCDGVGSSPCGGLAAQLVADYVLSNVASIEEEADDAAIHRSLHLLVQRAGDHLRNESRKQGLEHVCATTIVFGHIQAQSLRVCNVGDSRAYFLGLKPIPLSIDHTVAQQLMDRGVPRPSIPLNSHNALWQSVGATRALQPSSIIVPIQQGDRFLLCTDGVFNSLSDKRLLNISRRSRSASTFADSLRLEVAASNPADNYSAVIIDALAC
jgi:serine/threonine protein phosphatase PrpC